jgi:hypothetical protein
MELNSNRDYNNNTLNFKGQINFSSGLRNSKKVIRKMIQSAHYSNRTLKFLIGEQKFYSKIN